MASGMREYKVKRPKTKKAAVAAFSLAAEAAFFFAASRQKSACCDCGFRTNGTELLTELLDATGGIDDFVLAREEWVRFSRNLDLHQWVFFTVVGDFFAGLDGRTGNEFEIARQVVENNFAVIWMGIDFHGILSE